MSDKNWNRIEVPLPNGEKIVAEVNPDPAYPEIYVSLEDSDGYYIQDLCIIGSQYDDKTLDPVRDLFRVLVYGNENSEDFTHEIEIKRNMDDAIEAEEKDSERDLNEFDEVYELH